MDILLVEDPSCGGPSFGSHLASQPVVGHLHCAPSLLHATSRLRARRSTDLILLDVDMGCSDPLSLALHAGLSDTDSLLGLTAKRFDQDLVQQAMGLGCSVFLPKDLEPNGLRQALHSVALTGQFLPESLHRALSDPDTTPQLSDVQHEVLSLMRGGLNFRRIAEHLRLPEASVRSYIKNICTALTLSDEPDFRSAAQELGLIA